ncbi:hypothetical protein JCM10908_006963 [Rhodotorula pacifica]|uniref:uncharacterized protein n=1 Tax=Rhodotorula pacifica TaxID=1495444 RepID=UPI003176E684
MRFDMIALAALACSASAVTAASSPDGGSLEALLDRIAYQHDGAQPASLSAAESLGVASVVSSTVPAPTKVVRRSRSKQNAEQAKRWVWATGVIQDDTPNAPPVGQNVNQLGGAPTPVNTPPVVLPAPSYLPEAQVAAYLNGSAQHGNSSFSSSSSSTSSSSSSSSSAAAHTTSPAARRLGKIFGQPKSDHRRWIWATSVIQDGATDVPPPGSNANLLSNGAPATTPAATLVSPTFPPEPATTTTESTASQSQPTDAAAGAPVVAALASVESSSATTTSTSVTAAPTSPAVHWWNPADLFREIENAFEELLHGHSSQSAAEASSTAPASAPSNDKRWIWATSVIQDGATGVPAPGDNANLLTTPGVLVTTPAAQLVSPTFPPVVSASSLTTPGQAASSSVPASPPVKAFATSSSPAAAASSKPAAGRTPFGQQAVQVIAAVPPSLSSSQSTSSSSSPAASATQHRVTWREHQDLLLASASSASAAARQTTAGQAYRHKQRMVRARRH